MPSFHNFTSAMIPIYALELARFAAKAVVRAQGEKLSETSDARLTEVGKGLILASPGAFEAKAEELLHWYDDQVEKLFNS